METRDVIRLVLTGQRPPYVPWSMGFTKEAREKLQRHYRCDDLEGPLENHLLKLGSDIGSFDDLGNCRVRDVFGVVWDRSVDKDIGNVNLTPQLADTPRALFDPYAAVQSRLSAAVLSSDPPRGL